MRKSVDGAYTSSKAADQPPKSFYLIKDFAVLHNNEALPGSGGGSGYLFPCSPEKKIGIFPCSPKVKS